MKTRFTQHFVNSSYDKWPESEFGYKYHQIASITGYSDFFNEVFDKTKYTVSQMEKGLLEASSIQEWIENMKSKFNGEEGRLDEIYKLYTF